MFDGILFDLDGTLWDALPEIALSWNLGLHEAGVEREPLTADDLRPCLGMLVPDIAARLIPNVPPEQRAALMDRCCQLEIEYLAQHCARLFPGEAETLALLSKQYPLFVVSNCQDGYIQAFFQSSALGELFTDFECPGRTGLPKSENIRLVAERNGLKNPVYVGDTALDMASAQEAGTAFVHAAYGYGTVENSPAIHSFAELPHLLETLEP